VCRVCVEYNAAGNGTTFLDVIIFDVDKVRGR